MELGEKEMDISDGTRCVIPILEPNDIRLAADVVNLSSIRLSEQQLNALNGMVKFHQSPQKVPFLELIAAVESAARTLEETDATVGAGFRTASATAIHRAHRPKANLPVPTQKLLADLSRNENLVVTLVDKGGKTIVLDAIQYGQMCMAYLKDPAYERVMEFGNGLGHVKLMDTGVELFNESFVKLDASDQLV